MMKEKNCQEINKSDKKKDWRKFGYKANNRVFWSRVKALKGRRNK